ncbi:MAG: hypothetical protein TREMPRED_006059 [Tremellales sp. Tagirdzhanova-0007]|nr:MAG: hypothetical protein TREMPRED_006059 [Tremellales sp. Tagirdzhanova-0007]
MNGEHAGIAMPEMAQTAVDELNQISGEKKVRWQRFACQETLDYLSTLRARVKDVDGFWPFTLRVQMSHPLFKKMCTSSSDQHALSYLSDVELKQDSKDPRPFELVFHFKKNPYFTNLSLSKKYGLPSLQPPAPADGSITQQMIDFDPDTYEITGTTIEWTSDDKDLVARYPRERPQRPVDGQDDDDEFEGDIGSFFHFFTQEGDPLQIGLLLTDDILPDAFDYFTGKAESAAGVDYDSEDELDEEGGDDEEEIDLEEEEPARKRRKA